ncbi:MAG: site-2 protease family protein [Betaproteobacteria bacterium]
MDFSMIETILLYAVPVILAITLHEAAHGYVARMFGDDTAWMLGRVTLNPIKHIDPVGTIAVPLGLLLIQKLAGGGGLLFGWAKPVPVNFGQLRHPKNDMFWVAAAGPGANLFMALVWAMALKFAGPLDNPGFFAAMAYQGVIINVVLMVLNLLPLPPLDGGRIVVSLLPNALAYRFAQVERFGFMLVILLMATGVLNTIMFPIVRSVLGLISTVFGIGA